MILYRITKKSRTEDLSGSGAKIAGGRWNPKGFSVLYTSTSSSLALLEVLVHIEMELLPKELFISEIEIPDNSSRTEITKENLGLSWTEYPAPDYLKEIGKAWLIEEKTLILVVPSAVNPMEKNVLINPMHKEFENVKLKRSYSLKLDHRIKG